jgi:hypothetical protein
MSQEEDRPTPTSTNHALALGRVSIDRDPLSLLREMRAQVSFAPSLGWVIVLGKDHDSYMFKQLRECLAYNTGQEL